MNRVNISQLKHKLIIETPEYKKDGYGGYEVIWKESGEIWGAVLLLPVYKFYDRKSRGKSAQYKITTRNNQVITHNIRLKYESKTLSIISISNNTKDENFMNILTKEEHDNND